MLGLCAVLSLLITLILPIHHQVHADECRGEQLVWGPWVFNRQFTLADGCLVQVTPRNKPNLTYREYVFDQNGRLMAFSSLPGDFETATAQHNFIFLPIIQAPRFEETGSTVVVHMANGDQAVFTQDSLFVAEFRGKLQAVDLQRVDLEENSIFKVHSYDGLYIDTGWAIGMRRHLDLSLTSTIINEKQQPCEIRNDQIFTYFDPRTGEKLYQPVLKMSETALRRVCDF